SRCKSLADRKPVEPWELQPARDTGLTPSERFRSVRRESGLLESFTHHACFSLLRSYFAIAHRLTIIGREKLPLHGPFVLVANHCSHLDAQTVRSEEHTSELQSLAYLVCRLLLEKKNKNTSPSVLGVLIVL